MVVIQHVISLKPTIDDQHDVSSKLTIDEQHDVSLYVIQNWPINACQKWWLSIKIWLS